MQKTPMYKRCLWLMVAVVLLALPALSLAESFSVVKGGSLNLRQEASITSAVLGQYPTGTWMTVLESGSEWSKVKVSGKTGFVMSKYLTDTGSASTMYVRTNTGKGLNMRTAPSMDGAIVTSYAPGTQVNVLLKGNGWNKVQMDSVVGYMDSRFLSGNSSSGTSTTGYPKTGYVNNPGSKQVLLLRELPSTDAKVIGYYGNGVAVTLLGENGNFYKVTVDGKNGYMMKKYIKVGAPAPAPTPDPAPSYPEVPFAAKLFSTNGGNINIRFTPGVAKDNIIRSYAAGTEVTVLSVGASWSIIEIDSDGTQGFISNSYFKAI